MSTVNKRGQNTSWRHGLMRNLSTDLIMHGQLIIPHARAKELSQHVDQLITLAKQQTLHARREAIGFLRPVNGEGNNSIVVQKLFNELAKKYKKRSGGYTRILKTENRPGDNAPMALIQLV